LQEFISRKEAGAMKGTNVGGPNGQKITSVEEMYGQFAAEIIVLIPQWRERLSKDPSCLAELEPDVHRAFARGADLIVTGLLSIMLLSPKVEEAGEKTRRGFAYPLARPRERTVRIRLLGGLLIWATSFYCEPKKGLFRKAHADAQGLHVELAQFGFTKFESPALQSRIARQAALCPSLMFAKDELERGGIALDVKTVRRVTHQTGLGMLSLRRYELMQWRAGKLPAGHELKGKRVSVQIDGGRTRLRGPLQKAEALSTPIAATESESNGRSKAKARRTFKAQWREPKLAIIFVHDEHGRMVDTFKATVEGTFQGPDAITELVAMHLHRLGAAEAESVTFVSDGAPWIWDRIARICELAKIDRSRVHEVLDNCHAVHHVSLALVGLGLVDERRHELYREYRTLVRNGSWRQVVEELKELASGKPGEDAVMTELTYLRKHGEAGRLSFPHFRRLGIPLGSGAIESNIRRVINLRLKSNSMYWSEPGAESMLQVRAQVITDRWDSRISQARVHHSKHPLTDWKFESPTMSIKSEGENQEDKKPTNSQAIT
jgi:hypothetical protein